MSPEPTTTEPVNPDRQLLYETRVRNRQAALAAVAGVLVIVAFIVSFLGPQSKVDEATLQLIYLHRRFPLDLVAAVINGVGTLAIGWTLAFLYSCARARNPGAAPWIRWLPIIAGVLVGVIGVAYQVAVALAAHKFVTTGQQTYGEALHLTSNPISVSLQLAGLVGALLLALSFVLVSLHAMRVGLLTKFMGYLGMIAGALVLFTSILPIPVPVFQTYWLLALAYLLSGRWPSGVPMAWRTGRAEALPTGAELRARRAAGVEDRARSKRAPAPAGPSPEAATTTTAARTRSTTSKRKRKRRN